ncbi:hypothetical protein MXD63_32995 [Frankia sp. Cpl3]|uniref:hypothetical protein n=1 Tax=Parafrankia colletiae TaxID=573497 RepID=UPI0010424E88|nr:hypothetical protein [Parafrankia colletiae]MCK9904837.1 hypothetical protein [Frankia sp. Cpl3]
MAMLVRSLWSGNAGQAAMMRGVAARRRPDLTGFIDDYISGFPLGVSIGDELVECLSDEIGDFGIQGDDSFTPYGIALESLQDLILREEN